MIKKTAILLALAISINALMLGFVWAHHMFVTGINPFLGAIFLLLSLLIAIPIVVFGIKRFGRYIKSQGWIGPEKAFLLGFFILLIGDLINVLFIGNSTIDIQLHDTYFVLKTPHLLVNFAALFLAFFTVYWGFPRITGRTMNAPLSYLHFAITLIGAFAVTWPARYEGLAGMPRRYIDYGGWTTMNRFAGVNVFQAKVMILLILGQLFFVINLFYTAFRAQKVSGRLAKK